MLEAGLETVLHEGDGEVSNVHADPLALQLLGGGDRRAASTERVEHHVALVGGRLDDAFQESLRLLGWIAEAFGGRCLEITNVVPK